MKNPKGGYVAEVNVNFKSFLPRIERCGINSSRNPGFSIKRGIKFLNRYLLSQGLYLNSSLRENDNNILVFSIMESIGLIAGSGNLPLILLERIKKDGLRVVTIAFKGLSSDNLSDASDTTYWISPGELGSLIGILKDEGIKRAIMAGKVPKTLMFTDIEPDLRAMTFFLRLRDKKDESLLLALAEELESEGIILEGFTAYLNHLLVPKGVLTTRIPSEEEVKDIEFGLKIAREIGRLDIGQTVVIKNQALLAVEAIEGTDEAIKRGGKLGNGDVIVIKVSKPGQDMRFDVPVVGLKTMDALKEANAKVLALESGMTILLNREAMIKEADKIGLCIIGV